MEGTLFKKIEICKDIFLYHGVVPCTVCPPILGQLLDLISPAKINISEPRFESTHGTWQTSTASNINMKMKDRTFLKRFAKMR